MYKDEKAKLRLTNYNAILLNFVLELSYEIAVENSEWLSIDLGYTLEVQCNFLIINNIRKTLGYNS